MKMIKNLNKKRSFNDRFQKRLVASFYQDFKKSNYFKY